MNNNPLRYTDPTGHAIWQGDGGVGGGNGNAGDCSGSECQGSGGSSGNGGSGPGDDDNVTDDPATVEPSIGCSVVLLSCQQDDGVLSTSYTVSNLAYPQTQYDMDPSDKMMAEFTPVWWVNVLILLHDLASIPLGSNFVAKHVTHENAYAIVKYDMRKSELGISPYITSFRVVNNTNSPISVRGFRTEVFVGEPTASTYIQPGATINIVMPKPIVASSITIDMSHGMTVTAKILP